MNSSTVWFMNVTYAGAARRILVSLVVIIAYRLGCGTPLPGVDVPGALDSMRRDPGAFNLFAGGPLTSVSLFALGIMPYITSSILLSVLSTIPGRLRELRRGSPEQRQRFMSYGRWLGTGLAVFEAAGLAMRLRALSPAGPSTPGAVPGVGPGAGIDSLGVMIVVAVSALLGYGICLWLAELGTRYGFVNGGTTIILASTAASAASSFTSIGSGFWALFVPVVVGSLLALWVTWVHLSFLELPVRSARVPAVDAGSALRLRALAGGMSPLVFGSGTAALVVSALTSLGVDSTSLGVGTVGQSLVLAACSSLLAVVWAKLTIDPMSVANNFIATRRYLPGIAPGNATMHSIDRAVTATGFVAAVVATLISFIPFVMATFGAPVTPLTGPAVVLVVVSLCEVVRRWTSGASTSGWEDVFPAEVLSDDELSRPARRRLQA